MNPVMKYLSALMILFVLASCSNKESQENREQQLQTYNKELSELKTKISQLENEIEADTAYHKNAQHLVLVKVKAAKPERFEHFIEVVGAVEAVQEAYISPETGGRIRRILVQEGDKVRAGQVLAQLNIDVSENAIAEVKTQLSLARVLFEKQEKLWEQKIGSEIDFLQAKSGKESLENRLKTLESQMEMSTITSPINGIIEEVMQKEGELAAPGMMMMRVINLNDLYIKTDVAESHLPVLNMNDKVLATFPTWPGLEMRPHIHRIASAVNPLNRTITVSVKVKNTPDFKLRPNLLANIRFMDFESDSALVVPSICIKQDINGAYLYRMRDEGEKHIAEKVYVETGLVHNNQTLITKGLNAGDNVIVEGYNLVANESEVRL